MGFERVGEGLAALVAGWIEDPEARAELIDRIWTRAVGDQMARHTRVVGFSEGVLRVRIDQAAWTDTLEEMEERLRRAVNEALGAPLVDEIEWVDQPPGEPPRE